MIVLDKVTKRFGPKVLFEKVSLQFDPGKRYGLTLGSYVRSDTKRVLSLGLTGR